MKDYVINGKHVTILCPHFGNPENPEKKYDCENCVILRECIEEAGIDQDDET